MHKISKYFLQYMLNNGVIKYDAATELLNEYADKLQEDRCDINTAISEINDKIRQHLFRIDTRLCEVTGEKMCIYINTGLDEISKTANMFTQVELDLFESIITAIMESDAKCLSSIMCLNLTSKLKPAISKDVAQDKIDFWMISGYFVKQNGLIYLGSRCISEFHMFFKAQFPRRMTTCKLCTDSVYYGKICGSCNEVLHLHCITKYLNKNKKCPLCKKPWQEAEGRNYDSDSEDERNANDDSEAMDTDD